MDVDIALMTIGDINISRDIEAALKLAKDASEDRR